MAPNKPHDNERFPLFPPLIDALTELVLPAISGAIVKCRRFAGNGVANQDRDKIDHVVVPKAGASKTDPLLDRFEDSHMGKDLSEHFHLPKP